MQATILDGKVLAAELRAEIARETAEFKRQSGLTPGLGVILIGADPASVSYVTAKEKACAEAGMVSQDVRVPAETTQAEVLALVNRMNEDSRIHGILVQLPLPRHINESAVLNAISPDKDVDGFTPANVGRMILGEPCYLPCTPHGIIRMLLKAEIQTAGRHAVVVGRSNIVGKPVAHLLMRKAEGGNATVTVCHTGTRDLAEHTRRADILVVAAGRPNTVTGDMIRPGAVVIDVGVNRIPDPSRPSGFRLVGDVDFDSARRVASLITPVPGGVGPMTITMLLHNTLEAARRAAAHTVPGGPNP
ncbi:MAG TPA: bifunctional methylenetetrahydrofolate dehydrogenase/methenyltetrahydrofolate cyclohydrolase FolD [Kiritimatiellia bacterium]|jgi:methylenetetrahydrofolate dehydrogenase (NADP+)/methenyltetrahydrofolate cyclohydrolase|nr:bifunctional methylenetetrahydrofolate dehydrogenase/methenyltetrahydrofolate cyclohydrolase FolD [Kiritimatiellia bacterium]HOM59435.1 bifunctional methylenetetrahydrofolate dehydrogenase/methenyltetrahydrofolate cyclohydrolase FolD [Kiritimatiellia bacterium]HOR98486.1 bifunctional methylenetetrahydrofolate dehydrogenase/methenyltetrahydrofolate cyclohydrolase FolD [Kiritimatiellia bacterium]HPK37265.1 bifunctional methylenetetrahydrofolate dehydrogenase/methenyltetrahydrofolate cyclohydrol